jgi:hypothetical protein
MEPEGIVDFQSANSINDIHDPIILFLFLGCFVGKKLVKTQLLSSYVLRMRFQHINKYTNSE